MKKPTLVLLHVCLIVLTVASVTVPLSKAADSADLETIIVTAEKLDRTLQETMTSIAVVTGEELERRGIDDLYDVVLRTPNVGQSFGEKGFNIRGVDQRGAGAGTGLLINTIVDGASLPNNQATFFGPYSTWDLSQVEILRGPQGTTQGRNAIGGSIVVNTAQPVIGGADGKVRVSFSELGTYQLAVAQNVSVNDRFALRLAVDQRESDGWVDNPTRDEDYDPREALNTRLKAKWLVNDELTVNWTTSYTDSTGGEDIIDFLRFPERVNLSDGPAEEGSEHLINTLRLDYELSERLSLVSITTLYDHDYVRIEDLDASPLDLGFIDRQQKDDSVTTELRFNYQGDRWRGVAGLFYGDFDAQSDDRLAVPTTFVIPDIDLLLALGIDPNSKIFQDSSIDNNEENYALFGETEFDLTDRWTLIAGLRYDNEERVSNTLQSTSSEAVLPVPLPPNEVEPLDADFDALLPKLGLRYNVNEETTLGFTVQSAYRAGGQSVSAVSATVSDFDTEEALNYELSLRTRIGDRFALTTNVFYTDWEDQQVSVPTEFSLEQNVASDFITVNAGQSRLYGAELTLDGSWTDSVSGFVSIGLLDTEFEDFVSAGIDNSGNEFAYAPSTNFSVGINYLHPSGFNAQADVNWRGDQFSTNENFAETEIDSYAIANIKLGYDAEHWSIYAFVRNLFDEDYVTQLQPATFAADGSIAAQTARSAEPRVGGIEFNYRWGQ